MKGALQDQLLRAGLVSKEQQNSIKAHKKKQAKTKKSARKGNQEAQQILSFGEQQKAQVDKQKEERKQRDQKLNEEREASRRKRAIVAAIQQLVNSHRVKIPGSADIAFHFQQGKRVKKIWVKLLCPWVTSITLFPLKWQKELKNGQRARSSLWVTKNQRPQRRTILMRIIKFPMI